MHMYLHVLTMCLFMKRLTSIQQETEIVQAGIYSEYDLHLLSVKLVVNFEIDSL